MPLAKATLTPNGFVFVDLDTSEEQAVTNRVTQGAIDDAARVAAEAEQLLNRADAIVLLNKINTALNDISTKQAAFQTTPNLTTATPLLLELSQDMTGVLKALRYLIKCLS